MVKLVTNLRSQGVQVDGIGSQGRFYPPIPRSRFPDLCRAAHLQAGQGAGFKAALAALGAVAPEVAVTEVRLPHLSSLDDRLTGGP